MILICIISLLLFILIWLMVAPITLNIDTVKHSYWIRWRGVGMIQLLSNNQAFSFRLKIFFWQKEWSVYQLWKKRKPTKKEDSPKASKKRSYSKINHQKILSLLRSFQVKTLRFNLDTDDYVLNSYLFPVFYFLNRGSHELKINYQGQASLQLRVENRLYRMVVALLF